MVPTPNMIIPSLSRRCIYLTIQALILCGCYNQVLLTPDAMNDSTAGDIVVTTRDGRTLSFSDGNYTMATDTTGRKVVKGSGRIRPHISTQDEPFVGQIPVEDIESIYTSEKSTLFYLSTAVGIAAAVLVVVLVATFSGGGSFGG